MNVDLMFALPDQTLEEWETDLGRVLRAGAHQISTYPLFAFPYSDQGRALKLSRIQRPPTPLVRAMLGATDRLARAAGMHRCAVWSWINADRKKFSSVTRHHYVGFGPSAASMIGSHFHVNTFHVDAYAAALPTRRPIALCMELDERMEMAYWLYWRVYELFAGDEDFRGLFGGGNSLAWTFGPLLSPFQAAGMVQRTSDGYRITERGAFWIHRLQNEYSLNYINRLWGRCRREPWPAEVIL